MIFIKYPGYKFRIKEEGEKEWIFDEIRKQWVRLTPEEWVRQNLMRYLVDVMHYPASLIAVEKELMLGDLKKRFDILIYDPGHQPWMMIECKSRETKLSSEVLNQILRYNMSIPVPFLVISSGVYTYAWKRENNQLQELDNFPRWQ